MISTKATPIICFSAVDWDYLTMREHHLMTRLSRRYPVLYVEEQSHLLSLVRSPRKVRKLWRWIRGPRPVAGNLWVYSPPILLPFGRVYPRVNVVNQSVLTWLVGRAARTLTFDRPILWLYEPEQLMQIGRHHERLVVYDCADKHAAFRRLQRAAVVQAMEDRLFSQADLVFVVSDGLGQSVPPGRRYLVPNGADIAHFARALDPDVRVPAELARLPRPILGYVGTIDSRVDLDLVADAASTHPHVSFVLIGPVQSDVSKLRRLPNVRVWGRRPYAMLPAYLKGCDACLLPFRISELTLGGDPIKLYDYLAAGKLVVTTNLPQARRFADGVLVAPTREAFVQLIGEIAEHQRPAELISRQVHDHTWDERARLVEQILQRHLG